MKSDKSKTDEWLSSENLRDMSDTLAICDSEMLVEVRKIWPVYALTAASNQLDFNTKKRIKTWVLEQNSSSNVVETIN